MQLGAKINEKLVSRWTAGLKPHLYDGEELRLLVKTNKISPSLDGPVVTSARVLAFDSSGLPDKPPKIDVLVSQIAHVRLDRFLRAVNARLELVTGEGVALGTLIGDRTDGKLLTEAIDAPLTSGLSDQVMAAIAARPQQEAAAATDRAINEARVHAPSGRDAKTHRPQRSEQGIAITRIEYLGPDELPGAKAR
jgi:hypothetical protein